MGNPGWNLLSTFSLHSSKPNYVAPFQKSSDESFFHRPENGGWIKDFCPFASPS